MAKGDDSFVFFRSFYNQLKDLDDDLRLCMYDTIFKYRFENVVPDFEGYQKGFWEIIKNVLDRTKAHYLEVCQTKSEAGKKGGAPKGNQNARKHNNHNNNDKDDYALDFERIPISYIVEKWNMVYGWSAKDEAGNYTRLIPTMHYISDLGAPVSIEAQKQLDILTGKVCNYIKQHDINAIYKRVNDCAVPQEFDINNINNMRDLCLGFIMYAIYRLPELQIKPKSSNFGTIQWFLKFENVLKIFNGEIN